MQKLKVLDLLTIKLIKANLILDYADKYPESYDILYVGRV